MWCKFLLCSRNDMDARNGLILQFNWFRQKFNSINLRLKVSRSNIGAADFELDHFDVTHFSAVRWCTWPVTPKTLWSLTSSTTNSSSSCTLPVIWKLSLNITWKICVRTDLPFNLDYCLTQFFKKCYTRRIFLTFWKPGTSDRWTLCTL